MSTLVANARMYSATPAVKEAWKALLRRALGIAELPFEVIDYDAPQPLNALWARDDLGLAMMCGLPYSLRESQGASVPTIVAAPIPSPARYKGSPVYFTDIVVRADAPYRTLEDTFGGVLGYTLKDSMSGGVALRAHLAPHRARLGHRLYERAMGDLIHARGVIDALVAGRIDVGPLDSYYHDLLRHDAPEYAKQVRVVASTAPRPIPPFIATAALSAVDLAKLRASLVRALQEPGMASVRERLQLAGFAVPDVRDYDVLAAIAERPMPEFEDM